MSDWQTHLMPGSNASASDDNAADADLVAQARKGRDQAFNLLMRRHSPMVVRYLTRLLGNVDDAHDAAQETFVALHRNLHRFDPSLSFVAWLFHMARNKGRDALRKRTAMRWLGGEDSMEQYASTAPAPDIEVADRQTLEQVEGAIREMPEGLKTPLLLSAIEGLTHAEIGTVMGLTAKAVEVRIYRARSRLRDSTTANDEGAD
ncbi:RNA polymerase sigma factor [Hyphobacterium sp.]|uniref:RNA polymerase sigma factor n=1 Tax=Hyphobacterium sp. TaxID=2004662 RepID=UPI003BA96548